MNEHKMVLVTTYPTGAQYWACNSCSHKFVIQWPPNYKRIVLDEGDETAAHSGGTEGLEMGDASVQPGEQDAQAGEDYGAPFARWMEAHKND